MDRSYKIGSFTPSVRKALENNTAFWWNIWKQMDTTKCARGKWMLQNDPRNRWRLLSQTFWLCNENHRPLSNNRYNSPGVIIMHAHAHYHLHKLMHTQLYTCTQMHIQTDTFTYIYKKLFFFLFYFQICHAQHVGRLIKNMCVHTLIEDTIQC